MRRVGILAAFLIPALALAQSSSYPQPASSPAAPATPASGPSAGTKPAAPATGVQTPAATPRPASTKPGSAASVPAASPRPASTQPGSAASAPVPSGASAPGAASSAAGTGVAPAYPAAQTAPAAGGAGAPSAGQAYPAAVSASPVSQPAPQGQPVQPAQPSATPAAPSQPASTPAGPYGDAGALEDEAVPPPAITPFYAFRFSEGMSMPSIGGAFFGNNVSSTLGGKLPVSADQTVFAAYELTYDGPGMREGEGHEFQERALDHSISVGHSWKIAPEYQLSSRVQYFNEFRRSGANERFGTGLYDYWSLGLTERLDLGVVKGLPLGAALTFASVRFPNYTDLLQEFMSPGPVTEAAAGLQDFRRWQLEMDARFAREQGRGWVSVAMLDFVKAKVLSSAGTTSDTPQVDYVIDLGVSWKGEVAKNDAMGLTIEPSLRVTMRKSNQNFLRFKSFGDTTPTFIGHNYDYVAPGVGVPVRWTFRSGRSLFLVPTYSLLQYGSRPPRDSDNNYLAGKSQVNQTATVTFGYSSKLYAYAAWSIGYMGLVQMSNNHFERYLPYNYVGHYLFTSLDITY